MKVGYVNPTPISPSAARTLANAAAPACTCPKCNPSSRDEPPRLPKDFEPDA